MESGRARARARAWLLTVWLAFGACSSPEQSSGAIEDVDCTPGTPAACACADGTMSTQLCNAEGSGFLSCQCAGISGQPMDGDAAAPSPTGTTTAPVPSSSSDPTMPPPDPTTMPVDPPPDLSVGPEGLVTVPGATSVGIEWDPVAGATSYRVYWSTSSGVTPANAEGSFEAVPGVIHQGLVNGTTYHYVVTVVTADGESAPSAEAAATPAGEFVLQQLGTGRLNDIVSDAPVFVPVENRVHVVIAAEGYMVSDLSAFEADVDDWLADVFTVDPYTQLRDAFVVWSLPRPSAEHVPGLNTAFQVPIVSGSVGSGFDATASTLWSALDSFSEPLTFGPMADSFGTTALNLVVSFLIFDPGQGAAGFSGRATSLDAPDGTRRVQAAFARGHVHEFTHAFSRVRDEYMETENTTTNTRETSNVVATNRCSELPWSHLLVGGAINPSTDELVGAFGTATIGYHSELKCLMNGTHDNAQFYGGNGNLRTNDRLCNFCREMTAFRTHERTQSISSWETWKSDYRAAFWNRFSFFVPSPVPQTNSVGESFFDACVP